MANNFSETGNTGLQTFGGQIRDEFLRELQGQEGYKRYNEMRNNSPVIGAMLTAIEQAIRGVTWTFESDQGAEDSRIELLETSRDAMTTGWNDHISEALTMLPFGWSLFEIVYQRAENGRILWRKFGIRGQDTLLKWEFDDKGGLAAFWQTAEPYYRPIRIPIDKCLLYRTRVERNNPEGKSILRPAWIPYFYAKNIMQVEAIGIERDLAGLPFVKMPEGATTGSASTTDESIARKMVRNIRNDEQAGVLIPAGWEVGLMTSGGSRQFDTDKTIVRYESRMLMSVLAQFLMLGQQSVGSLALSRDQTDFFNMSVDAICDQIGNVITKYAIPRLCALNGVDPDGLRLAHSPAGDPDLTGMADFLQKVGSMLTWLPQDEIWLRNLGGLPEVDEETLEVERDRKQEQAMMIMQRTGGQAAGDDEEEESDEEEKQQMAAEYFEALKAPDDTERRAWEKRWERLQRKFFAGQQKRVIAGAKREKHGRA